jgi:hypothetical protein
MNHQGIKPGGIYIIAKLEIKRNINQWAFISLAAFLIILCILNQVGIEKFNLEQKQKKDFIHVQEKLIEGFINYEQYGGLGFERLLNAGPLFSLFYNSSTLNDLQANLDISTRYKLYELELGKNLFNRPTGGNLDFSWFFIIFGSLAISIWSFFAGRNLEYMMFLNNFTRPWRIYTGIILGRVILIVISILILVLAAWFQYLVNGIRPDEGEISALCHFFLVSSIAMSILSAIISRLGAVKNWKKGAIKAALAWIMIVLVWPEILNLAFSRKAEVEMKSLEEFQMQKNDLLLPLEKKALEDTGRYDSQQEKKESDRENAEIFWNVVSKKIRAIDLQMIDKTGKISSQFQAASIFNPVTFYKSTNNELGSKGYNSYNLFFRENLEIQRGFLRHVFNKRYYGNYTKVEPYLPMDQLAVKAEPSLPRFFTAGILLNLFYLVIAVFWGCAGFKRFIFPQPQAPGGYEQVKIESQSNSIAAVTCDNPDLYDQVTNVHFGFPQDFNGEITLDGQNIADNPDRIVVYVPGQSKIPGNFQVNDLVHLSVKMTDTKKPIVDVLAREHKDILNLKLSALAPGQRTVVLLDLCGLKNPGIYLIRDFKPTMYGKSLIKALDKLRSIKNKGALILCLSEIFMTPTKSYNYSYDSKEKKYIDLENEGDPVQVAESFHFTHPGSSSRY